MRDTNWLYELSVHIWCSVAEQTRVKLLLRNIDCVYMVESRQRNIPPSLGWMKADAKLQWLHTSSIHTHPQHGKVSDWTPHQPISKIDILYARVSVCVRRRMRVIDIRASVGILLFLLNIYCSHQRDDLSHRTTSAHFSHFLRFDCRRTYTNELPCVWPTEW